MPTYLYVLPLLYEDILKVGISDDPLQRVRAFSARYYECFDLSRSLLVAFDSRRVARRREAELHRALREWNAPMPITVPVRAAGGTEWYRGASAQILHALAGESFRGCDAHLPALAWWRNRLVHEQPLLYEWCSQAIDDGGNVAPADWRMIVDVLDAWPALGLSPLSSLPPTIAVQYRAYRDAWTPANL